VDGFNDFGLNLIGEYKMKCPKCGKPMKMIETWKPDYEWWQCKKCKIKIPKRITRKEAIYGRQ